MKIIKIIKYVFIFLCLCLLIRSINNNPSIQNNKDDKDDNVIYIKNFLTHRDYHSITTLDKDLSKFTFEKFRYSKPLINKNIHNIFYNEKYIHKINKHLNHKIYPSDFPIEHRFYLDNSPGMRWHKDLLMYQKPQYEAIFTINNNTKSVTQWKDKKNQIHEIWTEPNSLLIVKADNYFHHVTPPEYGTREILKLIYTQTDDKHPNYFNEMKRFNY
tara:strand:+ start:238 stop:882 length:645 start_codon:yes stop_codon:yes gene_type:complete